MSSNSSLDEVPVLDSLVADGALAVEPVLGPGSDDRRPEMDGAAAVVAHKEDSGRIEDEESGSGAAEVLEKGAVGCLDKELSFGRNEEAVGIPSKEGEDAVGESKEAKSIGKASEAVDDGSGFMVEDCSRQHVEQNASSTAGEVDLAGGNAQCFDVFADPGGDVQKPEIDPGEEENAQVSHDVTSVSVLDSFVGDRALVVEPVLGPGSDDRRPEMDGAAAVVAHEEDSGRIEAEESSSGAAEFLEKGAVGCSDKELSFGLNEEAVGIPSKEGEDALGESKEAKSIAEVCDTVDDGSGFMVEDCSRQHVEQNASSNAREVDLAGGNVQCFVVFADPGGDVEKPEIDPGEEENTQVSHDVASVVTLEVDGSSSRNQDEESGSGANAVEELCGKSSTEDHSCEGSKEVAGIGSWECGVSVGGDGAQVLDTVFGVGKEHDEFVTGSRLMEVDSSSQEDKPSAVIHTTAGDFTDVHAQATKDDFGLQNRGEKDDADGFRKGEVSAKVLDSITGTTETSAPFVGQQVDMASGHETRVMESGNMVARGAFGGSNGNDLDIGRDVGEGHAGIQNGSKPMEEDALCQEDEKHAVNNALVGDSVDGCAQAMYVDMGVQRSGQKDEAGACQESEISVKEFESTGETPEGSVDVVQRAGVDESDSQMNLNGEEADDLEIGSGRKVLKDDGSKPEGQITLHDIVRYDMVNVLPQEKKDVQDPGGSEVEVAAEHDQKQNVGSEDVQYLVENLELVAEVAPKVDDIDCFNSNSDITPVQVETSETSILTELGEGSISSTANRQDTNNDLRDRGFLDRQLQVVEGLQECVLEKPSSGDGKLETRMEEGRHELLVTTRVEAVVACGIVEAEKSEVISHRGVLQDEVAKTETELTNEERSCLVKEKRMDSEVMDHTLVDGCFIIEDGVHHDGVEEENESVSCQNPETDIMNEGHKPGAPEISATVAFGASETGMLEVLSGSGEVIDKISVNSNETELVQHCESFACRGQTVENKVVGHEIESSDLDLDPLKENISQKITEKVESVPADDSKSDQLIHVTGNKASPFLKSDNMNTDPANEDLSSKEILIISKSDIVESAPLSKVGCEDIVVSKYESAATAAEDVSTERVINVEEQNRRMHLIIEGMKNKDTIVNASEHLDVQVALFESGASKLSALEHDVRSEVLDSKDSKPVSENPNDKLDKQITANACELSGTQAALIESGAGKLSASEQDVQSEVLESTDSKLVGENPNVKVDKDANAGADTQAALFESGASMISAGNHGVQSEVSESSDSQLVSENPNDKHDNNFTSSCLFVEAHISETHLGSDNSTDKANFDTEELNVTTATCMTEISEIAEVQTRVPQINEYNDLAIGVNQETESHMCLLADQNYVMDPNRQESEVVKEDETSVLERCDIELIQQSEVGEQNSSWCGNDSYTISYQNMNLDDQILELPEKVKGEAECLGTSSNGSYQHASYCLPCFGKETFAVSDLVWSKVKSHPWWPGQIFGPSHASDLALKYQKKDSFLVAYFGDKTFAWCDRSQLKPFQTNFSQLVKQSSSDAFINSVDSALGEVSRRVELGMSCSCLPEQVYFNNLDHKIENAGVRTGVTNCITGRSEVLNCFLPDTLLAYVKALCQLPEQEIDKLELVILKAQLKAFYRSKGYFELPVFQIGGPLIDNDAELPQSKSENCAQDVIHHSVQTSVDNVKPKRGRGRPPKKPKHFPDDIEKEKSLSELTERESASFHANGSKVESESEVDGEIAHLSENKRRKLIDFNSAASVEGKMKSLDLLEDLGIRSPCSTSTVSFKIGDCVRRVASQLTRSPPIPKAHDKTSQKGALQAENFEFFSTDESIYSITEKRKKDSYSSDLTLNINPNSGPERSEEAHTRRQGKRRKSLEVSLSLSPQSRSGTVQYLQVGSSHRPVISVEEKIVDQCTPTALVLNFSGPNVLPTETDIIRIFSRYGSLKEAETEVHKDTNHVKVVFKRRADAEVAFSSAGKYSIFGPSLISYRLKDLPSPPDLPTNTAAEGKDSAAHGELDISTFPASEEAKAVSDAAQLEPVEEGTIEEVVN